MSVPNKGIVLLDTKLYFLLNFISELTKILSFFIDISLNLSLFFKILIILSFESSWKFNFGLFNMRQQN